jgi:biotin synthase-related radical SAM superfamily protein
MKNLKLSAVMSVLLGVMSSGPALYAQSTPPPTNSAPVSRISATRVSKSDAFTRSPETAKAVTLTRACAAAVAELEASRRLIDLLERENGLVKDRLETETRTTAILTELNESRKAESDALRTALAAKTETLAAKDEAITAQQRLIDSLKAKKSSPWKRLGDILIGAAAGMILR